MVMIELSAEVTEERELTVKLPGGFPLGQVRIIVEAVEAEAEETISFQPSTLGEILASGLVGAWEDQGITDSQAWVEEVRRKEREQRGW